MKVICWNIQKVNETKAKQFAPQIGSYITQIVGDEPFVFVVLENKTKGGVVLDAIGSGLQGANITSKLVELGGRATVKENVLLFAGNGATFAEEEAYTGWQSAFSHECQAMEARQAAVVAPRTQPSRSVKVAPTAREVLAADRFRNPVSMVAAFGNERVRFLAVHSPGPSDGDEHDEPYAPIYARAVLATATRYDMVIGDFNVRQELMYHGIFSDRSVLTGATTKGAEEGRHLRSRLDRVYCRPGLPVSIELFTDGPGKDLTDHHCMVTTLERREQREITDYFAYRASPKRRMELRQFKVDDAQRARVSVKDTTRAVMQMGADRRKRNLDRTKAARAARIAQSRGLD